MARPLSFVRLDIARFGLEISDRPNNDDLGKWVRSLYRSLALQAPEINDFGAALLQESESFRKHDSERKKRGFQGNPPDSAGFHSGEWDSLHRSDQIIADQNKQEKKIKREPLPRFQPPTLQEVSDYCRERGTGIDPEKFYAYYESNGWKVGRNPMKSWKAAITTWEKTNGSKNGSGRGEGGSSAQRNGKKLEEQLGKIARAAGVGTGGSPQILHLVPPRATGVLDDGR